MILLVVIDFRPERSECFSSEVEGQFQQNIFCLVLYASTTPTAPLSEEMFFYGLLFSFVQLLQFHGGH